MTSPIFFHELPIEQIKKMSVYERTSPTDTVIYLWAYSRGNNSYIGNVTGGEKIGALIVEKKK